MAAVEEGYFGTFLVRAAFALMIHLLLVGLLFGLLFWLTSDTANVHPDVLAEVQGQTDGQQSIQFALEDARAALLKWMVWTLGIGFVCSAIFLLAAQRRMPRIDAEARTLMPLWAALFIITIIAAGIVWWMGVADAGIAALIISGSYFGSTAAGFVGVILGFYLATALCVKATMKPSVPMSAPLPSIKR